MTEHAGASSPPHNSLHDLARAFDAVGLLVGRVAPDQWSAPTPCSDWTVRALVDHLIRMNRVFVAMLAGEPPPRRPATDADPGVAFDATAADLLAAFSVPGVLDRAFEGPFGSATGAERLQIRLYDLLAHGWDLARATDQRADLPDDVAERSLAFAQTQLDDDARPGRFAPPRPVDEHASAVDRLVAFLGRPVDRSAPARSAPAAADPTRLRCGIALRVRQDECEIVIGGRARPVRFASHFPSPRTERVSPGHLVAVATTPAGTDMIVWRWYDAVVLADEGSLVRLWEPAHGEVLAHRRPACVSLPPGSRAYLSAGLPGAEWWTAGPVADVAEDADVDLDEVRQLYTEHDLWDDLG